MALRSIEEREMVRDRRVNRLMRAAVGRGAITIFILWHALALFAWDMMDSSDLITGLRTGITPYMTGTGFMQGWTMFSPNPYRLDVAVEAKIHHADGSVVDWYFPRMATMPIPIRYNKERWRKYVEVAEDGSSSYLWPAMAAFAARTNQHPDQSPPVIVDLIRHSRVIPPPGEDVGPMSVVPMTTISLTPKDWN